MARPPVKAQELANLLTAQIRSGELAPGTWLQPERQLAEAHSVGRSTARQAIQILSETGLVEHAPGAGARVRSSDAGSGEPSVDIRDELRVIHEQLSGITARLDAIERHTGSSDG